MTQLSRMVALLAGTLLACGSNTAPERQVKTSDPQAAKAPPAAKGPVAAKPAAKVPVATKSTVRGPVAAKSVSRAVVKPAPSRTPAKRPTRVRPKTPIAVKKRPAPRVGVSTVTRPRPSAVKSAVKQTKPALPAFDGTVVALVHTSNLIGEIEPCG